MTITLLSEKKILWCKKPNAKLCLYYDYMYVKTNYVYSWELEKSKNNEHR